MRDLKQQVLETHGGLERFRRFSFLTQNDDAHP